LIESSTTSLELNDFYLGNSGTFHTLNRLVTIRELAEEAIVTSSFIELSLDITLEKFFLMNSTHKTVTGNFSMPQGGSTYTGFLSKVAPDSDYFYNNGATSVSMTSCNPFMRLYLSNESSLLINFPLVKLIKTCRTSKTGFNITMTADTYFGYEDFVINAELLDFSVNLTARFVDLDSICSVISMVLNPRYVALSFSNSSAVEKTIAMTNNTNPNSAGNSSKAGSGSGSNDDDTFAPSANTTNSNVTDKTNTTVNTSSSGKGMGVSSASDLVVNMVLVVTCVTVLSFSKGFCTV